ncbi:MAG TPA: prolyl oligopeptidase family serine peptidase, partial [Thermoanaerobaculia bacterium]|nr:prolyl oligopeptidase family serine peptidase [Thermoanaerobaculia bacterium]
MRMRLPAAMALAILSVPALRAADPPARPSKQYTIEQFLSTTATSGASFSADGTKLLFTSDASGIRNVQSIPVAGGAPTALTKSTTDATTAVSYFPNDDRFLFTRDQGGNELNHLYVQTPSGEEKDLTPGEKLKAAFGKWTRDGSAFYVRSNERDPRFFDLYRYDTKTYAKTLFYQDDAGYSVADVSDDGKWIALQKINTTADSDMYLWNTATKTMTPISKHEGTATYDPQEFDPDSKWLYFLTNDGSEFTRVRRYELATGKTEDVEKAAWDVDQTFFSKNGKYRVSSVNEDGRSILQVWDGKTGAAVPIPALPAGQASSVRVSNDESRIAFQLDSDRGPNNLWVYAFGSPKPFRLTDTMAKDIDPQDLVDAQVVRFKSFDGMSIPNIFYKPWQASAQAKAPALVWVHGGPGGQTGRGYSGAIQYLVNHGYVILGINNRGSSGYGKTFNTADDHRHGREPLWDCVEAKKYLQGLPEVDPNRIGIIGGSYGGYMVLAALAFQPEEFAVGVDIFGVSNWLRTLESMPAWWEAQRQALYQEIGDPVQDRAMLEAVSPLFHADKIRRPLMVL